MPQYVLAIDQGTTGTTALVIASDLRVLARVTREFPQIYPRSGWVEHDPEAIWKSVADTVAAALRAADVRPDEVAAIGITNQRETSLLWDRKTGSPVHNAIVWQCRRTAGFCAELKSRGAEDRVRQLTGLVLDPYFTGTKLRWILEEVEGVRARAEAGELAAGTIDTFLVWRLTGSAAHVTDVSNASRTLLMGLDSLAWEDELLDLLSVPRAILPEIRSSSEVYGTTKGLGFLPDGIPVAGMAGDQQAALFGQLCWRAGEAKCTFGTGAFLLMNTGEKIVPSRHGLLTTVAWQVGSEVHYALEGSAFIAGAAIQWLRDGLGIIDHASEVEALAASVPDTAGLMFVPALTGLGAPHWRPDARGTIRGIERSHTKAHLARAALEGIALQNLDILRAMEADLGHPLSTLKVDGGASQNALLMQLQADLLATRIQRPAMVETTALGAALLAGLAVGVWPDRDAVRDTWRVDVTFEPRMDPTEVEERLAAWRRAIRTA